MNTIRSLLIGEYRLWTIATVISVFGLVMIGSATTEIALQKHNNAFTLTIRHALYLFIAFGCFFAARYLPFRIVSKLYILVFILAAGLLILVFVPEIGKSANGAQRWIQWQGISIQPSEFAKLALIIFLAKYFASGGHEQISVPKVTLALLSVSIMAASVLVQPDYGTAVVLCLILFAMLFVAGTRIWIMAICCLLGVVVLAFLLYAQPYRMKRIEALLNPWENTFDSGYQMTQALMAIGRGGWFGSGLGNSVQKFFHLPEAHTDFLITLTIEELGLISCLVLLVLYFVLVIRILMLARVAMLAGYTTESFFVYGVFSYFYIQIGIVMGVNLAILPTTGLNMPLYSYGGSNLLISYIMLGFCQQIADLATNKSDKRQ